MSCNGSRWPSTPLTASCCGTRDDAHLIDRGSSQGGAVHRGTAPFLFENLQWQVCVALIGRRRDLDLQLGRIDLWAVIKRDQDQAREDDHQRYHHELNEHEGD